MHEKPDVNGSGTTLWVRFFVGFPIRAVVLVGLWSIGSGAAAQEVDLAPLPLRGQTEYLDLQASFAPGAQSRDVTRPAISSEKSSRPERGQGTSNDRILWTMPNFLTVENAHGIPPLSPGQKFRITARGLFDPFEFVLTGFVAGLGQASNSNPTYGQGLEGYGKRYGTAYADNLTENFMAYAVLPTILHQDPRYYQLGGGGFLRRSWHAVSRVLITRSDSGKAQPNISELGGAAAAAAISTYSYHAASERGPGNVVSVWATQTAWDTVTYMIKEFWPDLRKRAKKRTGGLAAQASTAR